MQRYTMFLDWKNQYCKNDYTTQGNPFNAILIKLTMAFFTELKQNKTKSKNLSGDTKDLEQQKQS